MKLPFRWFFSGLIICWILSTGPAPAALAASRPAQTGGENRAALVVQAADGSTATACVSFTEEQISGYDLLERSGMALVASFDAMGAAVCSINGQGCGADNCFCQFPPNYWSYWRMSGGSWSYSNLGASAAVVHNGDVDGWSWGSGKPPAAAPSFDALCGAAEAQPSPTTAALPSPTAVPPTLEPTWTVWIEPSATPAPTQTDAPTPTAISTATTTPSAVATSLRTLAVSALRLTVAVTRTSAASNAAATPTPVMQATRTVRTAALETVQVSSTAGVQKLTVFPTAGALEQAPRAGGSSPDLLGLAGFMILAGGLVGLLAFFWMRRS